MGNEPEIQFTTTSIISYQSMYDSSLDFHLFQLVSTFNNYHFGHLRDTYQVDLLFWDQKHLPLMFFFFFFKLGSKGIHKMGIGRIFELNLQIKQLNSKLGTRSDLFPCRVSTCKNCPLKNSLPRQAAGSRTTFHKFHFHQWFQIYSLKIPSSLTPTLIENKKAQQDDLIASYQAIIQKPSEHLHLLAMCNQQ